MTRRFRPAVDKLESRELLSVTALLALQQRPVHFDVGGVNGPNGTTLGQGTPNQYLAPTGNPTSKEARRQAFVFTISGAFRQGPGRYNDEASLIHVEGTGRSTYFLHGDLQLGALVPTDHSRPTSGVAVSFDRNINSNSTFGFDLNGTTANLDAAGRPTHFTALTDVNVSGGIFVESQSTSSVDIKYFPDGKVHPKGTSSGKATVVIRGFAYTFGTGNILGGPVSRTGNKASKVRV